MRLDHTKIKIHPINLSNISNTWEISTLFKINKIRQYAYAFTITDCGTILKYGESAKPGRDRDHGERLRRQCENIPGWGRTYRSPSGGDFQYILRDYYNETGIILSKDDITVLVYDFNDFEVKPWRSMEESILIFEAEKIKDHINFYGKMPIGNLREEKYQLNKTRCDESLETIFSW
jgi:hypothetical protein